MPILQSLFAAILNGETHGADLNVKLAVLKTYEVLSVTCPDFTSLNLWIFGYDGADIKLELSEN